MSEELAIFLLVMFIPILCGLVVYLLLMVLRAKMYYGPSHFALKLYKEVLVHYDRETLVLWLQDQKLGKLRLPWIALLIWWNKFLIGRYIWEMKKEHEWCMRELYLHFLEYRRRNFGRI